MTYTVLLKMDDTEEEKVHIKTLNKCIYLRTFLIIILIIIIIIFFNNHGDLAYQGI